jgi:hydroxymethylbilane synthase
MTRIVVANRAGALALAQVRPVLGELTAEWPDINLIQRTIQSETAAGGAAALVDALVNGRVNLAVVSMDQLPLELPDGVLLAAVTRRLEPRSTLLARGAKDLAQLPSGALVGVPAQRDAAFLQAAFTGLRATLLGGTIDQQLNRLASSEVAALVVPASELIELDRRNAIGALLEPDEFPPVPGQGSLGLLVRADDDLSNELAYTLQHRPSFDRVTAERAFQAALAAGFAGDALPVGALATVPSDGALTLFGAVVSPAGTVLQATTIADAAEAADLGRELGQDFLQQLATLN